MTTITYVIKDELGIHARPAGLITKTVKGFQSKVMMGRPEKMVDASKIIGIMSLGMKCGEEITLTVDGPDEADAVRALEEFLAANL